MRAFLEEYGRIIIIIVCVAALLGIVAIFKLKGFSLADSSLGAFVRNANSAINELEDANSYSVKMPKSTTAEIKSSGGNLAKVKAGETITVGPGYTNSEQTITIASLSEQTPGNATAADILAGKTVWVNGVQITGTMPNKGNLTGDAIKANAFPAGYYSGISVTKKGAATYVPGTTDQTIADNQFLTGVQTIKGDGNLVAANIAKGKTIFGITGTFGADTNATAADVLQGKTVYINGQKVTGTLNPTNYSSDATASADKILQGWTAYVNGKKITGAIPSLSATTVTPSATDQKIAGKRYLAGDITVKGDSNLKPENIKTGVSIYSVNGTYTSDATADAKKIMSGYTAYVNGQKITGTATVADFTQDGNAGAKQILSGYTAYVKGQKITGTLTVKDFTNDATATAEDVLVGKTAYSKDGKITGTLTTTKLTNDATATAADILSGKTAYVKGTKVIGTIESRTNYTVVGVTGNDNNGVGVGTSSIPDTINLGIGKAAKFASGYYPKGFTVNNSVINKGALNQNLNPGGSVTLAAGYYTGGTIKANSMSGTYTYPANSTGSTVDMGVNNTYRYVNASNVYNKGKSDGLASTSGTATAAQILSGYTAWVNGSKVTGSMPNNTTRTSNGNVPGINSSYTNVPTREGANLQYCVSTDGVARINIGVPEGYYNGVGSSYVNRPASDFGSATRGDVLETATFTSKDGISQKGSIVNRGALNKTLNPGDNISVAAGYYSGGTLNVAAMTNTYTYPSGSKGDKTDLGTAHTYRYVDAGNVYGKGWGDGYQAYADSLTDTYVVNSWDANGISDICSTKGRNHHTRYVNINPVIDAVKKNPSAYGIGSNYGSVTIGVSGEDGGRMTNYTELTIPIGTTGVYDNPSGHGYYYRVLRWNETSGAVKKNPMTISFGVSYHDGGSTASSQNRFTNIGWTNLHIDAISVGSITVNGVSASTGQNIDITNINEITIVHYSTYHGNVAKPVTITFS